MNTLCIRCGKPRVVVAEWKEIVQTRVGPTTITHTQAKCPDKECQRLVEAKQAEQLAKMEEAAIEFKKRAALRAQNSAAKHTKKPVGKSVKNSKPLVKR